MGINATLHCSASFLCSLSSIFPLYATNSYIVYSFYLGVLFMSFFLLLLPPSLLALLSLAGATAVVSSIPLCGVSSSRTSATSPATTADTTKRPITRYTTWVEG